MTIESKDIVLSDCGSSDVDTARLVWVGGEPLA
jgi:hypothetical protein